MRTDAAAYYSDDGRAMVAHGTAFVGRFKSALSGEGATCVLVDKSIR